jgi:hypothetical protein
MVVSVHNRCRKWLLFVLFAIWLLILGCKTPPPANSSDVSISWIYPVEKIRNSEDQPSKRQSRIAIHIAGNEYEMSLAHIVNKGSRSLSVTSIETNLPSQNVNLKIYLLGMIEITRKTRWFDPGSVLGEWPDACIPLALHSNGPSRIWSEPEGLSLAPGASISVLFEWYASAGVTALDAVDGSLEAEVQIHFKDQPSQTLSVSLQPTGFSLPWAPSFTSTVGINYQSIMDRHRALSTEDIDETVLWLGYLKELGEHRLYPYNADPARFPLDELDVFDPEAFDRVQGALLDGTLFPTVPPANSVRFRPPPARLSEEDKHKYYMDVSGYLASRGHLGKLYYYTIDEPLITDFEMIKTLSALYTRYIPGLRVLVTEPYTPLLAPEVDIWCPDIFSLGDSLPFFPLFAKGVVLYPDFQHNPGPSVYRNEQEKGKEFWVYTCTSAQVLDYPNLFIDSPAAYHRIIPWIMHRYGATGFLYYNTTVAYRKGDPWKDQFDFEANGDGTLFYPGHEGIPFIKGHTPVVSLRMKILRDGFEDYEYLRLLEKGQGPMYEVSGRVAAVARSSLSFSRDISAIAKAREDLIHALSN